MSIVSVEKKREFIEWFKEHYKMKWRECLWILEYLLKNEGALKRVHFVERVKFDKPISLFMSTQCTKTVPFKFYKNNLVSDDPDKAFDQIRFNQKETIFIELNFADKFRYPLFIEVLEGEVSDETDLPFTERLELAQVVNDLEKLAKAQLIDHALDTRNEELFRKLIAN
ncbi:MULTISPECIES: YpiB family protein [Bacillus]|uniref:YpiB family protein n=1 Tax=Bacillus TaxID=1386 RepID=UPI0012ACAC3F|nr:MULTISPECIES: YpiB family protein [Bacillus]MCP1176230.1 YpiB family protein [Bacillus sp. 1663tsa1]MRS27121.1 IDEAL domain-containing protein [Bacillus sp. RIT694]USL15764.1 YpiB family protein [Bacillus thuringiensis]